MVVILKWFSLNVFRRILVNLFVMILLTRFYFVTCQVYMALRMCRN